MKIIIFGSGNIGRGLIPEVFGNDNEYIFLDINNELINKLNSIDTYKINKFNSPSYLISNFKAYHLENDRQKIEQEIINTNLITTAVGFNNLKLIADYINSLNIPSNLSQVDFICFENNVRPSSYMRDMIKKTSFNFIDAVVDRIIPNDKRDSLDINCEKYFKVIIEDSDSKIKNKYPNCLKVKNLNDYIKIKLFMVNGLHFIVSILGYNSGYKKIHLSLQDQKILDKVQILREIYCKYIPRILSVDSDYVGKYFDETIIRFKQPELNDDNERIARNMILKLGFDNRVIPIYELAKNDKQYQEFYKNLIINLYSYDNPNDADSMKIKESIRNNGLEKTIMEFSKIKL